MSFCSLAIQNLIQLFPVKLLHSVVFLEVCIQY